MIALAVTSVLISRNVFVGFRIQSSPFVSKLHIALAYNGLILLSIHLGCHMSAIMTQVKRIFGGKKNLVVNVVSKLLAAVLVIAGVFASCRRDVAGKLFFFLQKEKEDAVIEKPLPDQKTKMDDDITEKSEKQHGTHGQKPYRGQNQEGEQWSRGEKRMPEAQQLELSTAETKEETLEEFLGGLFCSGCGKHCSLLQPQCGRGISQANQMTEYYYSQQESNTENDTEDNTESNTKDNTENNTRDNTESNTKDNTENNTRDNTESNTKDNVEGNTENNTQSNMDQKSPIIQIETEDESLLTLFGDFIPIAGIYVVGTYYLLEIVKKTKNK